jgi:hypothetical protein
MYLDPSVTNFTSDYNLVWSPTGNSSYAYHSGGLTWAAWQALGYDVHGVNADPTVTNAAGNDFTLLAGSPAIGAGTNLGAPYNLGPDNRVSFVSFPTILLNQDIHPTKWTIGAFVFPDEQLP